MLAYYYALLHTKINFTGNVRFPVVIESPNQKGKNEVHLPQMVKFVFDHVPDDAQIIVEAECNSGLDLNGVTILTYGISKRQVLRQRKLIV